MKNKTVVIGVVSIFLLTSLAALPGLGMKIIGTEGIYDDIITVEPAEPNGNFEWYVTPVDVTFHAEDDIRLAYIYYKVTTDGMEEPEWTEVDIRDEQTARYDLTITIDYDGIHHAHFYAVDHVDNVGPVHSSSWIKIDMTSPTVTELQKEKVDILGSVIIFTAVADDATSGIHTVKFYVDGGTEPINEDASEPYQWTYELIDWIDTGIQHTVTSEAYDYAGNSASKSASTSRSGSALLFHFAFLFMFLHKK